MSASNAPIFSFTPAHAIAARMGHSEVVSREPYLTVTPEMFDEATGKGPRNAMHIALQYAPARTRKASQRINVPR